MVDDIDIYNDDTVLLFSRSLFLTTRDFQWFIMFRLFVIIFIINFYFTLWLLLFILQFPWWSHFCRRYNCNRFSYVTLNCHNNSPPKNSMWKPKPTRGMFQSLQWSPWDFISKSYKMPQICIVVDRRQILMFKVDKRDSCSIITVTKSPNNNETINVDTYNLKASDSGYQKSSSSCSKTNNQLYIDQIYWLAIFFFLK